MYIPVKKPTNEEAIEEKLQVLKDFYVIISVEDENAIRAMFRKALREENRRDPNVVLDRIARDLIAKKLA